MKSFSEFISSPYFNRSGLVISLFNCLSKYHPDFKNRNLTIEKIFLKVFPNQEYNYHKINNVISDLYKLTEKFIVQMYFEKGEYYIERNILRELRHRGLSGLFEQRVASYTKKLLERNIKDEDYYYYLYELTDEYLWYHPGKNPNSDLNILQTEFDHFLKFALIRLLRFYTLMLHERNQTNIEYDFSLMNEIANYVDKHDFKEIPSIEIFNTILKLLQSKESKYYEKLWKLKEKHFNELNGDVQRLLYVHLTDFAAYMVNFKGNTDYNNDLFKIYREMLEINFHTPDNFRFPELMNIVKISCRVKEYEFAKEVFKRFEPGLNEEDRINVSGFCLGVICYSEGNYNEAIEYLSRANFKNFIFRVQVKILLLKSFYLLNLAEQVYQMIDTFKHYIAREQSLLQEHRDAYLDFLNCMIRLNKIKNEPGKKEYELVKLKKDAEMISYNPFLIKTWLIDELNSI